MTSLIDDHYRMYYNLYLYAVSLCWWKGDYSKIRGKINFFACNYYKSYQKLIWNIAKNSFKKKNLLLGNRSFVKKYTKLEGKTHSHLIMNTISLKIDNRVLERPFVMGQIELQKLPNLTKSRIKQVNPLGLEFQKLL